MVLVLASGANDGRLSIRRHRDIEHFHRLVREQLIDRRMTASQTMLLGDRTGITRIARGDRDRIEAGLPIGDQMAIADDEAGPDATDAEVLAPRQSRLVVEMQIHVAAMSWGESRHPYMGPAARSQSA